MSFVPNVHNNPHVFRARKSGVPKVRCGGCWQRVKITKAGNMASHYDDASWRIKCEWSGAPATEENTVVNF